ncbi:sulfotransferase domain-containing protein [Microbacterium sp. G2-8]|uniref:sulfotransferase domain-containing protein n=1 Tax=Microbacterium sp. G2-8 TaxID=2842454 RepID=UPI001C8AF930|nr:sulfotransferase domain-containing protein [Microbacterium sp. G2-8]
MTSPLIHVGLHKTGTTWLQAALFRREEAGYHDLAHTMGMPEALDLLARTPDLDYDLQHARTAFAAEISAADERGLVPVLSHERLSGYPPGGSFDRTVIAHRLAHTFTTPRVLLVIREQTSHLESMYSQYISDGGHQSLNRFLRGHKPYLGRKPEFRLSILRFDTLITFYREVFGPENLLVLPFEQMKSDPLGFAQRVASFSGASDLSTLPDAPKGRNRRRPMTLQGTRRVANSLLTRTELNERGLLGFHSLNQVFWRVGPTFRRMTPVSLNTRLAARQTRTVREHVGSFYADSNRRTSELLGIDLAALGYDV